MEASSQGYAHDSDFTDGDDEDVNIEDGTISQGL